MVVTSRECLGRGGRADPHEPVRRSTGFRRALRRFLHGPLPPGGPDLRSHERHTARNPLDFLAHRPWPLPPRPWVMAQRWRDLLFAHWPVDPERIRPRIPESLTLDCHSGMAWVSLTPFRLEGLRLRGLPGLPWVSSFPELNFRTYVTRARKPGVFFLSLDAASVVAVMGARAAFHLPYFLATMRITTARDGAIDYRAHRSGSERPAEFQALYRPVPQMSPLPAEPGTLDHWLTERYCLYAVDRAGGLYRTEIHHAPWALQPVEAKILWNTVSTAGGIELPPTPALTAYARSLDVRIWWPVRLRPGGVERPARPPRNAPD